MYWLAGLFLIIGLMGCVIAFLYQAFKQKNEQYNKMARSFFLLYDWMALMRENDRVLALALQEKGITNIMIYGWGYLGKQLCLDLQGSEVKVTGIIDRRPVNNVYQIPVYSLQKELPDTDAIIITVLYDEVAIRKNIERIARCQIINLEELI